MKTVAGSFEVKLDILPQYNTSEDAKLARMAIERVRPSRLSGPRDAAACASLP